MLMMIKS